MILYIVVIIFIYGRNKTKILPETDRRHNAIKVNQIHPITFCCDIYHSKIISNIYINI